MTLQEMVWMVRRGRGNAQVTAKRLASDVTAWRRFWATTTRSSTSYEPEPVPRSSTRPLSRSALARATRERIVPIGTSHARAASA